MPVWAWLGVAIGGGVIFFMWNKNKQASSQTASASTNTPGGVDASLVPQFVNQTYVNGTPPGAPSMPSDINVTLSGNPNNPVVTSNEGSSATKIQGLSITPYKSGTVHVGFGGIPGAKKYTIQVLDTKTHKYVYNQQVATTHPTLHLPKGTYEMLVSGVGYTGTVTKDFTVP